LGFDARVRDYSQGYGVTRGEDGIVTVVTPLDDGSAEVRFLGTTEGVLGLSFVGLALMMTALAGWLGTMLGTALGRDLRAATRDVRDLGTEAVLSGGTRVVRAARFRMVARLGQAIEQLAGRFAYLPRLRSVPSTRDRRPHGLRGLFFASVSHDLKSPLNAVLGFTELVRRTELSPGQLESLDLIDRRGRELLALIETILDAARVEAGQLSLVLDAAEVPALLEEASIKGKDLASLAEAIVVPSWDANLPLVRVDPCASRAPWRRSSRIPCAAPAAVSCTCTAALSRAACASTSSSPAPIRISKLCSSRSQRAETQHRGPRVGSPSGALGRRASWRHRGDRRARRRSGRLRFIAGNARNVGRAVS
jgi:signal transduction histidine kinase